MEVFLLSLIASTIAAPSLLEALHPYYVAVRRVQQERYRDALPLLDRTIAWQLHLDEAYLLRALVYERLDQPARAFADYDALLARRPRSAMAFLGRGRLHHWQGDVGAALRDYDDAVDILPDLAGARYGRAMARLQAGFSTAAAEDVVRWLQQEKWTHPTAPFAAIIGILAWRQAGNADQARVLLAEALRSMPEGVWPRPLFDYLRGTLGVAELLSMTRSNLESVHAHTTIGLMLAYGGSAPEALPYLQWVEAHGEKVRDDHARGLALRELERLRGR